MGVQGQANIVEIAVIQIYILSSISTVSSDIIMCSMPQMVDNIQDGGEPHIIWHSA